LYHLYYINFCLYENLKQTRFLFSSLTFIIKSNLYFHFT